MGISFALLAISLVASPAAYPIPSDCQADQVQEIGKRLHFALGFVSARCAGESVAYLCTEKRCLKNPCGGYEAGAPRLQAVGSPAKSSRSHRGSHRSSHRRSSHPSHSSASRSEASRGSFGGSGELIALLLHGSDDALEVVDLSVNDGMPACHPLRGLDQVLVDATNKAVKIGETLGRSGAMDAIHGHTIVLTRGLYAGGDEPGAPSHGYLRIHAKISGKKLEFTSAGRITQDVARFGKY